MTVNKFLLAITLLLLVPVLPAPCQRADQLIGQYQLQLIRGRNTAEAWSLLGYAFLKKGRESSDPQWSDSAEAALNRAWTLDSASPRVNKYLAMSQANRHQFRPAIRCAKRALAGRPSDSHLLGLIGDAYLELGKPDSARLFYQRMDSAGTADVASLSRWGRYGGEIMGEKDSLRACLSRAAALACSEKNPDPENLAWLEVMLGEIEFEAGNLARADSFYQAALRWLPDYPLALEHAAEVNLIEGKTAEALQQYRRCVSLSKNPGFMVFLADVYEKAGQLDSTKRYYSKAESTFQYLIAVGNAGYLRPLAELYLKLGKEGYQAFQLAQRDLFLRQDVGAYLTLGRVYLLLNEPQKALQVVQKAGPDAKYRPEFCYYAGEIYLANGRKKEARQLFEKTLKLCPAFEKLRGINLWSKLSALDKIRN